MISGNHVQNGKYASCMGLHKLGLALLFIVLMAGCTKQTTSDEIIKENVFIDVLVDIHMADAILVAKGYRIHTDSTSIRLFYNDVLIEHNVTQKQIENTFEYYTKNPKKFEKVYDKVSENIVKLEEEYKKSKEERIAKDKEEVDEKRKRYEDE